MKLIFRDFSAPLSQRFPLRPLVAACLSVSMTACGFNDNGHDSVGGDELAVPPAPALSMSLSSGKQVNFSWEDVTDETEYRLLEKSSAAAEFSQVASFAADSTSHAMNVFIPAVINASYVLQACNSAGCSDSAEAQADVTLANAGIYVKASNTDEDDNFGGDVAFSEDGTTLAIAATNESSAATGVAGDESDNTASQSGAVYVFVRNDGEWTQQAYLKASNSEASDQFGFSLALSGDGNTLAIGANQEDSTSTGINGDSSNNSGSEVGAVYVFSRSGTTWSQQAYVKASNAGDYHQFGYSVGLSLDGNLMAVGATAESTTESESGAVYTFTRSGTTWSQQALLKASNPDSGDGFGVTLAVAADGNTLAVGANHEASNAQGIDGDQANNSADHSGAAYVFARDGNTWSQEAYIKASNAEGGYEYDDYTTGDEFGVSVALSADGNTLAVGAKYEASNDTGINGDEDDNSAYNRGAAYVFNRSGATWAQQAYIKAPSSVTLLLFGNALSLSGDGKRLAVGSTYEPSNATGINGDDTDTSANAAGAVFLFDQEDGNWSYSAYVKATNTEAGDTFGKSVAMSGDGKSMAVGATGEASNATGIGGDQTDNSTSTSGAVYLY